MKIMKIMINIIMSLQYVIASIPLAPFMYDEIKSDKYIIDNVVSDSTELLQYDGNSMKNDMKDKQFWDDFLKSLYLYGNLLKETKQTGEYYDIDFEEMNRTIMEELCFEMGDEIDYMCKRDTKTYELTILSDVNNPIDIDKINKLSNDKTNPYIFN